MAAEPARVLVVDDDPLSRAMQARLVALFGHEAIVADTPQAALDAALSGRAEAMLVDLGMPDMDGFALLARLRAEESRLGRAPVPVIAVTGYAAPADRMRCLMAGFNDHLCKPVDAGALHAVLARNVAPRDPAAPPPADAGASDLQRLQATAQRLAHVKPADRSFGPTVLETFAMRSGQLVEELQAGAHARDFGRIGRAAQALRASAEFMGASGMAALCTSIDSAAARADAGAVAPLLSQLVDEHQAVLSILLAPRSPAAP